MMVIKNPATWLAALILTGCSTAPAPTSEPELPKATLDQPETIKPQTFIMRGRVTVGHETRSFSPCNSPQQYWLDLTPQQAKQAIELTHRPYQELYGELIGYLKVPSQTGYNADFTARFVVEQVNLLTAENPNRCDQPLRSTHVFGTEPFWSAKFTQGQLHYSQIGGQSQAFTVDSSRISQQQRDYQFSNSQSQGSLQLTKQVCNDGMSDSLYGWQASFTLDKTKQSGCATLSNQDPTLEWSGLYFASSTQNVGFSVQLQLNDDHSAMTTYSYNNGEPATVEKGFWQQLNNDQIQVVMTQHQQQYLISERVFTRNGFQLNAEKEKVGNAVYPIANGGLTLFKAKIESAVVDQPSASSVNLTPRNISSSDQFNTKVDQAIRDYFTMHKTSPDNTQYRWLTYDLNGDGKEELLAQLDWCGSGGCTLLIFENHQDQWRFNSRVTLVQGEVVLGKSQQHGWQDLIFNVSGGGATPAKHKLVYSGVSYPLNPSVAPVAMTKEVSRVVLFADGVSPAQSGVKL